MIVPLSRLGEGRRTASVGMEEKGSQVAGCRSPPARWVVFVSASPRWFAPPITTVPAEGPSAECFDRPLPRHPPGGGPGACSIPSWPPSPAPAGLALAPPGFDDLRRSYHDRVSATESAEREALVSLRGHLVALLAVDADPADVGHEHPRLARDVGAHVPGRRERVERHVAHLVDVLHPRLLRLGRGLDGGEVAVAQVAHAVRD